ncbi:GNAT family N-acetyltransferase [Roseobacteraceae bacterium NS-SX3]
MTQPTNSFGQPIGAPVPGWHPRPRPPHTPMAGRYCRLEPLAPAHAAELHAAFQTDAAGRMWTYLPAGPFADFAAFEAWLLPLCESPDPLFFAILDAAAGNAVGMASYLRMDPANGAIEVGHIAMSPLLQRTPAATEAMYLMMARAFGELGYRRYEWKCDALNAPSRRAAERLGFTHEGVFRQAAVTKGRNRDTAWYSVIDREWPALKQGFEAWLAPENFGADGSQKYRLAELAARAREDN